MPEAAVDEKRHTVLREDEIGSAGQAANIDAKAQAEPVQASAQCEFRRSVALADAGHQAASGLSTQPVHHAASPNSDSTMNAMHGPGILCRTLSTATTGSSSRPFAYGNQWQYHSQSDRHSKIACWGMTFDLLTSCSLLRAHIADGKVGLGINHELRDFRNNKKKNLDMVLCRAAAAQHKGGSKSGVRGAHDFAGLADAYGLALTDSERRQLAKLPPLAIAGVATVLVATEAKAAMTAHQKALPRLKDELTSSHQTVHGDNESAIAAGLVMINAATRFVSSSMNKVDLARDAATVSTHRQPQDAEKIVTGLRDIQRRSSTADAGFDALGVIVVDCVNDGSTIRHVTTHPPAPAAADDFDYARFVHRVAHLYSTRFAAL